MWKYSKLAMSDALTQVSAAISVAHPWVYGLGQKIDSGAYLSPQNALAYLAKKLPLPGEGAEVLIILITGESQADFIKQLRDVTNVLPLPALTQVKRMSASAATLAIEKMQIPAPLASMPTAANVSVQSLRTAVNARLVSEAQSAAGAGFDLAGIKGALEDFSQLREAAIKTIAGELEALTGKSANAWIFSSQEGAIATAVKMLVDIPNPASVFSAAVMFTGNDLQAIRKIIHENESDTRA